MTSTAASQIRPHRPGLRAWAALIGAEMKMVIRDTAGLVIPIGLPLLILVMNGLGTADEALPGSGGLTVFDVYVIPLVLTIVLATVGVVNMPSFLAYYRRARILRRLAVTPAHPAMALVAQAVTSVIQTVVGIALALAVAVVAFDANLPNGPGVALAVLALSALAMYSVGFLVAAVAPTGNASVAIGLVLFFAMGAAGGLFGSTENLPDIIVRIGEVLPFGAAVQAFSAAWSGTAQEPLHLLSMVGTIVVSSLVAARLFRWE
jgi:ABC-2 type transport system permease protein